MSMEGSVRSAYVGANVKPGVKDALRAEAKAIGGDTSVSQLISDILETEMTKRGHDVDTRIPDPNERPLPFRGYERKLSCECGNKDTDNVPSPEFPLPPCSMGCGKTMTVESCEEVAA